MSTDPLKRQEVYGDGDHVHGNAMEPGGWSKTDNAHKPGRVWTGKAFWLNPEYDAESIDKMLTKCHEDFPKDPLNTSYLIALPYVPQSTWFKTWTKYYETVEIIDKGSILFSTKASGTYSTEALQPAGNAGGTNRVFINGTPWPVIILYRNAQTRPTMDPALLAHFRFGHAHSRRIDALFENDIPTGLDLSKREVSKCDPSCTCATCKLCKMPRPGGYKPGEITRHEDKEVHAYISSDISGPYSPPSSSGYRYIIVFVCRASGYSHVYFMTAKSEATDIFLEFLAEIGELGVKPERMCIKTDAESVYVYGLFQAKCRELGIKMVNSPPYVHELNANAEKLFRDLADMARALMHSSGFPVTGWPHAFRHANWLRNRLPSQRLGFDTPYFRAFGAQYDLSGVRVFGCRAFTHVPADNRTKLENRSVEGLYVGHHDRAGGAYLVYYPDTQKTKVVAQPSFIEDLDVYESKLINTTFVPDVPSTPADIHDVCPTPFSDTIETSATYAIRKLGAWYNKEDHELVALVQLSSTSAQTEAFWTPTTVYLSNISNKDAAFKLLRAEITSWHFVGNLSSFYPLFTPVLIRAGGGKSNNSMPGIITAVDTSLTNSPQNMYTVIYEPSTHLKAQDLPESRIEFISLSPATAGAIKTAPRPKDITPNSYNQAISLPDSALWEESVQKEMQSIEDYGVMDYGRPPRDANIIGTMFVFKIKLNTDGSRDKLKTRLVALGNHQEYGETFTETFAPGTQLSSSRLILLFALQHNLLVHHMDVRTAFLQSEFTDDVKIWIRLPPGFKSKGGHQFAKLKRPLYGVRQAAREWYLTNTKFILSQDPRWRQSKVEPQLFYIDDPNLFCVTLVHTDDFFGVCNDDIFWKKFEKDISARFDIDIKGELDSMLQMSVTRVGNTFELSQRRQIQEIIEEHDEHLNLKTAISPMEKGLNLPRDTDADPKLRYRQLVGQLLWIARCTRPDILFAVSFLAQFSNYANKEHWIALTRVLRYLKTTILRPLVLKLTDEIKGCMLNIESDSDWAGDSNDRKSYSGSIIFYNGGVLNYNVAKQATVSLSSTEAEYIAASEACKEGLYFRNLIDEIAPINLPIHVGVDNLGAGFIAQNSVNNARTKHIDIRYHMIRDWISKGIFELFHVRSADNRADLMTKALAGPAHQAVTNKVLSAGASSSPLSG
jgi:hypothetical protein